MTTTTPVVVILRMIVTNANSKFGKFSGARAFCFTTGMAALTAVSHLVQAGEEVIVNDDGYGGTYRL